MTIDTVSAFIELIDRYRLLTPEQIANLIDDAGRSFLDPRDLARHLVRHDMLTPFQVNQLFLDRGNELVLGQYVLTERLGEGGMGQVFKARHLRLNKSVALKVIRKERLSNAEALLRFQREMQLVGQLSHPNIVMAFDADCIDGTYFYAMEYVDGIDLRRLVKQLGPLGCAHAYDTIYQAALGLQHAHERGLVHRDIKPNNLILQTATNVVAPAGVTPAGVPAAGAAGDSGGLPVGPRPSSSGKMNPFGVVKLLDLGLARLHEQEPEDPLKALTRKNILIGTPDFVAPEQASNAQQADIRADIYSLGCTFYYLLTARVPFPGGSTMDKLLRHRVEDPVPLDKLRPEVPRVITQILQRMLAKRREDRFATPAELAEKLLPLIPYRSAGSRAEHPPVISLDAGRAGGEPGTPPRDRSAALRRSPAQAADPEAPRPITPPRVATRAGHPAPGREATEAPDGPAGVETQTPMPDVVLGSRKISTKGSGRRRTTPTELPDEAARIPRKRGWPRLPKKIRLVLMMTVLAVTGMTLLFMFMFAPGPRPRPQPPVPATR